MNNETSERKAVFISKEVWEALKKIAEENNRTLGGQIKEWVNREK